MSHTDYVETLRKEHSIEALDCLVSSLSSSCYNPAKVNTTRSEAVTVSVNENDGLTQVISDIYDRYSSSNNAEKW